ncbi:TPA: class I SAM-dependent methyltransferase [Morganella morganii]|uniref:SAM-dependent methyltransferase n=1 Tax=Morganella morganii TaxID=582 RepID=UPI001A341F57|nr:class I SAM-dependent methyltransferase [Morganella morganii]MCU6210985.1 class I SAM-dependent methyltransferase [Morganella morganii]MCU6235493.1 class I SAM-dependent methyltransferase [Morganella morganii]HAT1513942.1 class I SAM-dependent methyltransferase [Morganella morganii]
MSKLPYKIINSEFTNEYENKVVETYHECPERWKKAIGDSLLFQFGVYDTLFSSCSTNTRASLDKSGIRYFERQLFLANVTGYNRPAMKRILDVGCGWGYILKMMADNFPECDCLDGINVSASQLQYCSEYHKEQNLQDRINLYLCNAENINLLPDYDELYDLVIIRGVISHFPNDVYEDTMKKIYARLSVGGKVIISDNLYNTEPEHYISDTPDEVDRLACRHRKSPAYFRKVLEDSGFFITDFRVLPSNIDVVRWLMESKKNIECHFPEGTDGALEELRVLAENWSVALLKNKVSTYSIILEKS